LIAYIKGKIEHILETYIILENNNIGYQIFLCSKTISKIKINDELKIFTYTHSKEDGNTLYGFLTIDEINMFNILISVSGVGPKVGVGILSTMTTDEVAVAIVTNDYTALSKAPGIGKKTSQRIVLELKDKVENIDTNSKVNDSKKSASSYTNSNEKKDATEALISLGYSKNETLKAVMEVSLENMKAEEIIKLALKKLSRKL
jgi:holliday junction DNA helicase RuvA